MIFNVTEIEFDFTDDEEGDVPLDCQQQTIDDCLGPWEADDEDDLIEEITNDSAHCINSIDYRIILKWQKRKFSKLSRKLPPLIN